MESTKLRQEKPPENKGKSKQPEQHKKTRLLSLFYSKHVASNQIEFSVRVIPLIAVNVLNSIMFSSFFVVII